ncbi:hypothetical protein GIB67_011414 [Kingdonia uniflora]|uniref:Uncharacterized protein n=1 Tax=Kingdonia uniflora TaxID=39325 RepID=A0A7J7NLD3_9MAGN|nr:hypothetical protein GIB67_011414 [Kingdonia uniflora]
MLAVWMGSQADEVFPEVWHSDSAGVSRDGVASIRSKVYLLPKLWYLRVNVIEAQELHLSESRERGRFPKVYVKAFLGNNTLRAKGVYTFDAVGPSIQVDTFCVHGCLDGYITGIKGRVQCLSEDDMKNSESDLERIEMIREKYFLR